MYLSQPTTVNAFISIPFLLNELLLERRQILDPIFFVSTPSSPAAPNTISPSAVSTSTATVSFPDRFEPGFLLSRFKTEVGA